MARTLIAQTYVQEEIKVGTDRTGNITSYVVTSNISFGDSKQQREDFDLWPILSVTLKTKAQDIQDFLKTHLDTEITG